MNEGNIKLDIKIAPDLSHLLPEQLLVIKKDKPADINNEIGRFFKKYNIIEHNPPGESFNIDIFYRLQAYAAYYKASGSTVNERKPEDITISVVIEEKPVELFKALENRNRKVNIEMPYKGIYYIKGNILFPIQVIVTDELTDEGHTWIKSLSRKMDMADMKKLLYKTKELKEEHEKELANSVIEAALMANKALIEEIKENEEIRGLLMELSEETAKKYL